MVGVRVDTAGPSKTSENVSRYAVDPAITRVQERGTGKCSTGVPGRKRLGRVAVRPEFARSLFTYRDHHALGRERLGVHDRAFLVACDHGARVGAERQQILHGVAEINEILVPGMGIADYQSRA